MQNSTMLYKCPGPYQLHNGNYDYIIVDKDDEPTFKAALEAGWYESTPEALAASKLVSSGLTAIIAPEKKVKEPKEAKEPKDEKTTW